MSSVQEMIKTAIESGRAAANVDKETAASFDEWAEKVIQSVLELEPFFPRDLEITLARSSPTVLHIHAKSPYCRDQYLSIFRLDRDSKVLRVSASIALNGETERVFQRARSTDAKLCFVEWTSFVAQSLINQTE